MRDYIKLGEEGQWEESSIREGKLRIGWSSQSLEQINQGEWAAIRDQLCEEIANRSARTRDFNALKTIVESTSADIWITFHRSKLWWCRVDDPLVYEDKISKYRKAAAPWRDADIEGNPLLISQISGKLAKIQGFRGTVCRVINDK